MRLHLWNKVDIIHKLCKGSQHELNLLKKKEKKHPIATVNYVNFLVSLQDILSKDKYFWLESNLKNSPNISAID